MPDKQKTDRKPYVAIYGDNEEQKFAKTIWSLLSTHDLRLASVNTVDELLEIAPNAVLILIVIQDINDKNNDLARIILGNPRVVAETIAFTDEPDMAERIKIMACGFNSTFHSSFLDYPEFKQVLLNKIEKGFVSLENRIQQEEYRRFKAALAASPDAFIIFDENRKLAFVSEHYKSAYPMTGPRLIRGMDVLEAFEMCSAEQGVSKGDPRYDVMRDFWDKLDGEIEFEDAGRIWHIKAKSLLEGQGSIVTTTDITRYKSQQRELEHKGRELTEALQKEQEASAIQKQFINMVSHEFRTPLSIVDGNAQILYRRAERLDKGDIEKRAKIIRSAVSRLVNMMEGVLSSNLLKTGRLEIVREPVDLGKLIADLCEEYVDLAAEHRIEYEIGGLPPEARLDRKLITLVISNLISNAVKFSREDPHIDVRGWQDDGNVILEFQDNGIGIPPNEIDKVFERFYRTTIASGIPGTGIGLNLTKDLIELHGGTINVESEQGKGTKFVVRLPLKL